MAITVSREAYLEFRCFGVADRYPKDVRAAVTELRRRGYDASVALLQYMVEEGLGELYQKVQAESGPLTIGQLHDALRDLHVAGVVPLSPFTQAMYQLQDPECCLIMGREIMGFAGLRAR